MGYHRAGFTEIVGVDSAAMPRYPFEFVRGDALEYLAAHGHEFDAIHASPPCQAFSTLRFMPNAKPHPDLVDPTRQLLIASGKPYVIENVMGAPLRNPTMLCGTMFGLGTGDAELRRHRIFETNWNLRLVFGMFCRHGRRQTVIGVHDSSGRGHDEAEEHRRRKQRVITVIGERGIAESCGDRITVTGAHGDAGVSIARRPKSVGVFSNAGGESKRDGLLYFSTAERNEAMGIDWMKGGEISQAIPPAYTFFIGCQLLAICQKPTDFSQGWEKRNDKLASSLEEIK